MNQGVDVVWWMADFEDGIDPETAGNLYKVLRSKKIMVFQHDFDGGNDLTDPEKSRLSRVIGGETIVGSKKKQ